MLKAKLNTLDLHLKFKKKHRVFLKSCFNKRQKVIISSLIQFPFYFVAKSFYAGYYTFSRYESVRRALLKKMSKILRLFWILTIHEFFTKKPKEMRMGKGKGAFTFFIRRVAIGDLLGRFMFYSKLPQFLLNYYCLQSFKKLPKRSLLV